MVWIKMASLNKSRPTKRAPDAGESAHIPSSFLRLIIFLVGRLRRPRPSAGNANRWAAVAETQKPKHLTLQREIDSWELS
jgi:hypothetical protein